MFDEEGNPLIDVEFKIGGVIEKSDRNGKFEIDIPLNENKEELKLYAEKDKYKSWSASVFPGSKQPIKIILEKR